MKRATEEAAGGGKKGEDNRKLHQSPTWMFVGLLRGHPALNGIPSHEAVQLVDEIVDGHGGWAACFERFDVWGQEIHPRADFIYCWDFQNEKAIEPLRRDPTPADAARLAKQYPLDCDEISSDRDAPFLRVVGICYWLAAALGDDGEFFLSSRDAGRYAEVSPRTASAHLKRACRLAPMEMIRKGTMQRASEFRFDVAAVQPAARESTEAPREAAAGGRQ